MPIRRAAFWISTMVVAIVVALAVPVSQLRLVYEAKSCCCPDPTKCHCADHEKGDPGQDSIHACHSEAQLIVTPDAQAFTPPALAVVETPVRGIVPLRFALAAPHAPPSPARPDAPS